MKKILVSVLLLAAMCVACTVMAFAADTAYFYVHSEKGNDAANGLTASTAVKTFTQACRYAEDSGAQKAYIVVTNAYNFSATVNESAHTVPFVITTKDAKTDYGASGAKIVFGKNLRYVLAGNTTFENITVEYTGTLNCVAQYNHVTFGTGVVTKRTDNASSGLYVVGGWQSPDNNKATGLDSHITVQSGDFLYVIGGSRQRAELSSGLVLTGTHYIDVQGGNIVNLLGASAQHNWSQNAFLTMSGGYVQNFFVGGDASRRLNGTATVTLTGGKIDALHVNNVVGNAKVELLGTAVGSLDVSYYNAEVEELYTKAKSTKTLVYDARYHTAEWIAAVQGFDVVQNNTFVYAKEGAKGDGKTESTPTSFAEALQLASQRDAVVVVIGKVTLQNLQEPAHGKKIQIVGKDDKAAITVKGTYTLAGETAFSSVAVSGNFDAKQGVLIVEETAKPQNVTVCGSAYLYTGSYGKITEAGHVLVSGNAAVQSIVCGDKATVEIHGGSVGTVDGKEGAAQLALTVSGGTVDKVVFRKVTESLSYTLMGGEVKTHTVASVGVKGKLVMNESLFTAETLGDAADLFSIGGEKVFFLADGATGSGMSITSPSSSLIDAYAALGKSGGTIVVCDKFTLTTAFNHGVNTGKITFTSVYDGVDYQKTNGAAMILAKNFYCGGVTEFCNITLQSAGKYVAIYGNAHPLVMGENITSVADATSETYLSVIGGSQSALKNAKTDVTIYSGTWQRVRGGTAADGSSGASVHLAIYGGYFMEVLALGSTGSYAGDITAEIHGGFFRGGIVAMPMTKDSQTFSGNIALTVSGGTVHRSIKVESTGKGSYSGSYTLTILGGNLAHVNEITGTAGLGTMTSTLQVAQNVDLNAEITGDYSFTNPIRNNGADPWLFYCDGYYYYTATTGSTVGLARAANIGDLKYAEYKTIYNPEDGHEWSRNLWSPEIHYYTDAEIGAGNGGWYLFMACDDGENEQHRMYVAKCLDGDNLYGGWGNPLTGEVNFPQRVEAKDIPGFDDRWAAGMSEIRINGKLYMLYITEAGRGTPDIHQTVNIVEMTNPWTIVGQSKVICFSEYDWEMGGYAKNPATGKYWPKVVEGSTAVYGADGSVYIVYSGSGYWTVHYNLAQLKYIGGDPLEITSWEKSPEPILYKSDSINGCGHASYVTDTSGQGWVCYHAYIGKDTSSGRFAFVEPYYADKNGVVIADGSGHPASIDTVYTVPLNPLPIAKRISGFDSSAKVAAGKTVVALTIGNRTGYVNDAPKALDASPVIRNSRTMLPVRFVAENLGATVGWDGATSTVTVKTATTTIEIVIGKTTAKVNGREVTLDAPAFIENSRTYLPVRFVAENLGATVAWDGTSGTATLTK